MEKPSLGKIVIYNTTEHDKEWMRDSKHGIQNSLPAIIVAIFDTYQFGDGGECNLKVFIDGSSLDMWKTSVPYGIGPGYWNWP